MPFLRALTHAFFIFLPLLAPVGRAQSTGGALVPKVWLRGDAGKIGPTLWPDYSGQGLDATAADGQGPGPGESLNFNPSPSMG